MADTAIGAASSAAPPSSAKNKQRSTKSDRPKTPASQEDSQAESKPKKVKVKTDSDKESPAPSEVAPSTKSKRSRSRKDRKDAHAKIRSKVVIRRLPPNVPEDVFWGSVAPWVKDAAQVKALKEAGAEDSIELTPTVDFKAFVPGKLKSDPNKENVQSRAYVRFVDPAMVVEFHKHYDGHVFRDSKGKESIAIVEFVPYQKIPTERRRKADARQGTIEEDESFKAFLERLEAKSGEQAESKTDAELMAHLSQADKDQQAAAKKSTPLLDHLRATKAARAESAAISKANKNASYRSGDDKVKAKSKSKAEKAARKAKAKEAKPDKAPVISGRAINAALNTALSASASKAKGKEKASASEKETDEPAKKTRRQRGGGNKSDAATGTTSRAESKKEKKAGPPAQEQPAPGKVSILKRDGDGEASKEPAAEVKKKSGSRRSRGKAGGAKASGASAPSE